MLHTKQENVCKKLRNIAKQKFQLTQVDQLQALILISDQLNNSKDNQLSSNESKPV